ncbi:MAG: hypothetical protein Pg6A_19840 [Termitinemataceae bacterium]|nr:MAG: hypothetical protein Pg6A_19840 [Termitinemataceae bacterium]
MPLFESKSGKVEPTPDVQGAPTGTGASDDWGQYAGMGLDDLNSKNCSLPWLGISQAQSKIVVENIAQMGVFFNSATMESYGNTIEVIPVYFKPVWVEKDSSTGKTLNTYEVKGIPVNEERNEKGYPEYTHPDSGNKIVELYTYALVLKNAPEEGFLLFRPGLSALRKLRAWNSQLRTSVWPNGMQAPIFGFSWKLSLGIEKRQQGSGSYATIVSIQRGEAISPTNTMFVSSILPARQQALAGAGNVALLTDEGSEE